LEKPQAERLHDELEAAVGGALLAGLQEGEIAALEN
jgi:hypothetical protein